MTSYSLDTPWGLGEENFAHITRHVAGQDIEVGEIVEFGSGVSTVRLALEYPMARVTSIEESDQFGRETRTALVAAAVADRVRLIYRPLRIVRFGLRFFLTYALRPGDFPERIDLLLVDGPTERATLRGREAPLYYALDRCRTGSIIVLDDYHRSSARRVVENWLEAYPDSLQLSASYPRLAVLTKVTEFNGGPHASLRSLADNVAVNAFLSLRWTVRKIRGLWRWDR